MITAPTRLDIIEHEIPHPDGAEGTTIHDVAMRLEHKYALVQKFVALHKADLETILAFAMADAIKHGYTNDYMDKGINGKVKEVWRMFLINEEHGIRTRAAEADNRQSFVKSGSYMNDFTIGVGR